MTRTEPIDSYLHKGLRQELINSLRGKGIKDEHVLTAMNALPRHWFMDSAFDRIAYEDKAFPIDADQTISQPYIVALQSQLLEIKKNDKILEIGTGSAYQAGILAELGAKVFSIERQKKLFDSVKLNLLFLKKYHALKLFYGDGFLGLPTYAPFDKIIITAGAPIVPPKLMEQLKVGGYMIIPLTIDNSHQKMLRLTKNIDGSYKSEEYVDCEFVPMLNGKNG